MSAEQTAAQATGCALVRGECSTLQERLCVVRCHVHLLALRCLHIFASLWFSNPTWHCRFLWSQAAVEAHAQGLLLPDQTSSDIITKRAALLEQNHPIDPRRVALTILHFPAPQPCPASDASTLDAIAQNGPCDHLQGDDLHGDEQQSRDLQGESSGVHQAGYDPHFLMLFCVKALQEGLVGSRNVVLWGLLALALRCTAADDAELR